MDSDNPHFDIVAQAILERRVIPFLGSGANLCDLGDAAWDPTREQRLPSGSELAKFLAEYCSYPPEEPKQLAQVSQYAASTQGLGPLYEKLQSIFTKDYQPTSLHQFLASLPATLRGKGQNHADHPLRRRLIFVTTNYDDLLERALDDQNEPYHKLVYMADVGVGGGHPGNFTHWTPDGRFFPIEVANEYRRLEEYERSAKGKVVRHPVIIKIHGAVDRSTPPENETVPPNTSYVITEDHYIDYITRAEITNLLPMYLAAALKKNHYLFLGYSLQDWNLRVILRRIWKEQKLDYKSWAVQIKPALLDRPYWTGRGVEIIEMNVRDYVQALRRRLE